MPFHLRFLRPVDYLLPRHADDECHEGEWLPPGKKLLPSKDWEPNEVLTHSLSRNGEFCRMQILRRESSSKSGS